MTWFNKNYKQRKVIAVDCFATTGTPTTVDAEIAIPADWDAFWDVVRSDFLDVVITDANGVLQKFKRSVEDYANRGLTIQIDDMDVKTDNVMVVLYVYFDYASESVDRAVVFTAISPKTAHILLSKPHTRVVGYPSPKNVTEQPLVTFVKGSNEQVHIFFMFSNALATRIESYNERLDEEAIQDVSIFSYDSTPTESDTRYVEAETRISDGFVRATFKAGDSGSTYTCVAKYNTTFAQLLETRANLKVFDQFPE